MSLEDIMFPEISWAQEDTDRQIPLGGPWRSPVQRQEVGGWVPGSREGVRCCSVASQEVQVCSIKSVLEMAAAMAAQQCGRA